MQENGILGEGAMLVDMNDFQAKAGTMAENGKASSGNLHYD